MSNRFLIFYINFWKYIPYPLTRPFVVVLEITSPHNSPSCHSQHKHASITWYLRRLTYLFSYFACRSLLGRVMGEVSIYIHPCRAVLQLLMPLGIPGVFFTRLSHLIMKLCTVEPSFSKYFGAQQSSTFIDL